MRKTRVAAIFLSFCFLALAVPVSDSDGIAVTPEPSMVALLAVGLSGIGLAAWRRNRRP